MPPPTLIAKFGAPRGKGQAQVFLFPWRHKGPDGSESYQLSTDGKAVLQPERSSDPAGWGSDYALFSVPFAFVDPEKGVRADLVLWDGHDSGKQLLNRYEGKFVFQEQRWAFQIDKRKTVVDASQMGDDTPLFRWSPDGVKYETVALDKNRALPLGEQDKHKKILGFEITFELWLPNASGEMVKAPKLPPVRAVLWGQEHPKLLAAREAHRLFLAMRDLQVDWMRKNAERSYVAQWCEGLAGSNKAIARRIDSKRLERFKREFETTADETEIGKQVKKLTDLLADPELKKLLNGMEYRGACERAVLVQGLGECRQAWPWMDRELEDEKEGIIALIANADTKKGAKELKEKSEPLFKTFEAVEPWIDGMTEWAGSITRVHKTKALVWSARKLEVRYGLKASSFAVGAEGITTRRTIHFEPGVSKVLPVEKLEFEILNTRPKFNPETIERIKGGVEAFARITTVLNVAIKVNDFAHDPDLKGALELSSGLLNLVSVFGPTAEVDLVKALARPGRVLEENALPRGVNALKLAAIEERAGEGLGKHLGRAIAKNINLLAALAGLIDAVTSGMAAKQAYDKGKKGEYTASALGVVGGALMALGSGMTFTGIGAPLGAVLFVMGAIIQLVSTIFGVFGAESPLEGWVAHSEFGDRWDKSEKDYEGWSGDLGKQIDQLKDLVFTAQFLGKLTAGKLKVDVKPTMLTRKSQITAEIRLGGEWQGEDRNKPAPILLGGRVMDGAGGVKMKFRKSSGGKDAVSPSDPLEQISFELDLPADRQHRDWPFARVELKFDPEGTGVPTHQFVAELKPAETGVLAALPAQYFQLMEKTRLGSA